MDWMLTRPIPSPRIPEKVKRIFTIGVSQVINLLSPLRNLSKTCACFWNTSKTELGELEFSNAAAKGCDAKFCPVRVLYSFDAAPNIAVKLAEEGPIV